MDPCLKLIEHFYQQSQTINLYTELHIFMNCSSDFKYSILKRSNPNGKFEKKKYSIKLKSHSEYFRDQIVKFINKFHIKKLVLEYDQRSTQNQIQWDLLKQLVFQQVKVQQMKKIVSSPEEIQVKQNENHKLSKMQFIKKILKQQLKSQIISFQLDFQPLQLFQLLTFAEKYAVSRPCSCFSSQIHCQKQSKYNQTPLDQRLNFSTKFSFFINLQKFQIETILHFIQFWCTAKIQFCFNQSQQPLENTDKQSQQKWQINKEYKTIQHFKKERMLSGQHVLKLAENTKKIEENTLKNIRNQLIVIQQKGQFIAALSSSNEYGYSLNLSRTICDLASCYRMAELVLRSEYFISLEIETDFDLIDRILEYIFEKFRHHSNYLIKIGNQVELTSYRLMLNTTNLHCSTVKKILKLIEFPGHYQLIFYGPIDYLQILKTVFIKKAFIKFNYFLPISQVSAEISEIITKMEVRAENFKRKLFQFCCILNDHSYQNLSTIEAIYLVMQAQSLHNDF